MFQVRKTKYRTLGQPAKTFVFTRFGPDQELELDKGEA
jgi:hypothetical protein